MSGNDEPLEPVPLGGAEAPKTTEGEAVPPAATATAAATNEVADPWAIDEAAVAAADAEDAAKVAGDSPAGTAEALSKLKVSSKRLASNLDSKLGLSNAFGMLGNSVKNLDQQTHVSETVKSAAGGIGSWFSSVDEKFNISQKGKEIGSSISSIVPTEEISHGIQQSTRALQTFDESHGITKTAASGLATGADFLTNSIGPGQDGGDVLAEADSAALNAGAGAPIDQTDAVDGDGLPSSFQK